jgi:DNA-directed RNA polymerase subunit K/omega
MQKRTTNTPASQRTLKTSKVPLQGITETHGAGNIYQMTNAIVRRAEQLNAIGGTLVEECDNKVVTAAMYELFSGQISYKTSDD